MRGTKVTSAWWVQASQVTKVDELGEPLQQGVFAFRGRKNFLPPLRLEMGVALLFRVADDCVANHAGELWKLSCDVPSENACSHGKKHRV